MSSEARYAAVPYLSLPYPGCHPDAMAVVAHLAGLEVASPAGWRVLDLGCGDGGNLLAIAAALPGATCLGIDGSAEAIARGQATAAAAGLAVELRVGDLTALDPGTLRSDDVAAALGRAEAVPDRDLAAAAARAEPGRAAADAGRWDAIVVHGVWSWAGDAVRAALPEALARLLAPSGIVHVSHLALPGAHLLAPAREVARRRAAREPDPARQVAAVRAGLDDLLAIGGPAAQSAYAGLLRAEARRWTGRPDFLLFHDILDPDATPFALADMAAALGEAGLAWLGESRPEAWWRWRLADDEADRLTALAGPEPRERQEAYDDLTGPVFKASLWVHADRAPARQADPQRALDLRLAAPTSQVQPPRSPTETSEAAPPPAASSPAADARVALAGVLAPVPRTVRELAAASGLEPAAGAEAALRLAAEGGATLTHLGATWAPQAGEHPVASGLARAQAAHGTQLATLRHTVRDLDHDFVRLVLEHADGTRTRADLARDLSARAGRSPADLAAPVEAALTVLARAALLAS